jgi:hypothetical protein
MTGAVFHASPIFSRSEQLLLWLMNHTEKYPKCERFRLARRLEDAAFEFQECLLRAVHEPDEAVRLREADVKLDQLRLLVRLCVARKLMSVRQYEYVSGELVALGKLLGAWQKKSNRQEGGGEGK